MHQRVEQNPDSGAGTALDESQLYERIEEKIHAALASAEVVSEVTGANQPANSPAQTSQVQNALEVVAERIVKQIGEENFVRIEVSPASNFGNRDENGWWLPYRRYQSGVRQLIQDAADLTKFALQVQPDTYGWTWLLVEKNSGRVFDDIGDKWAKQGLDSPFIGDLRSIEGTAIKPGMQLVVCSMRELGRKRELAHGVFLSS